MSNISLVEKSKALILKQEQNFAELAKVHGAVHFKREASFANQALTDNSFLATIAAQNPDSLVRAVLNVAAIGLSLSPVHKYAYLVPRDGKVMLDLSYKGLAQLAIEARSIKYVAAEIVFEKDKFVLKGRGQEPVHEFNPFDIDRGELVGAYCIAKTYDDEFIVTTMTIKEILDIRDRTQAYKAFLAGKAKSCPWVSDFNEMAKKTVIRRASKSWPMIDTRSGERMATAMDVVDTADAIDFEVKDVTPKVDPLDISEKLAEIREILATLERSEEKFVTHLSTVNRREIKSLDDLTSIEVENALILLYEIIKLKSKKPDVENEKP